MSIEYLNGRRFRQAVVAGSDWVRHRREFINSINVFPVADGDTGTNMALSLSATASAIRAMEDCHLGAVASRAAEASILGAKGNSGVILAHWFLGLSKAFVEHERADGRDVAEALVAATQAVYHALERPVEGTVITVMRAVSEHALEYARQPSGCAVDLVGLLDSMVETAGIALARTPEQLAVLREAHVVDAGAQGYVDFLEGALRAVRGEAAPSLPDEPSTRSFVHDLPTADQDLSERFCTEVVVRGRNLREARLRKAFRPMGGALLVVTTGGVFKLHIHTNHPDEVIRQASRFGVVEERKVDDMLRQREERTNAVIVPVVPLETQPATVAVVCDSTADLPPSMRAGLGIEMAPLQVLFGDRVFRDQVDLSTDAFYELLESDPHHPTTSQPPPRAFVEALDRIRPDREVLVVTLSSAVSGTHKAALAGSRLAVHPRVSVYDSRSASLGLGMMTANAARLAARGAGLDELEHWLDRWREGTGLVFALETLEYLRRGGRIGTARGLLGRLLGVRAILTIRDGRVEPLDSARSPEEVFSRASRELDRRLPEAARVRIGLIEIGDSEHLDRMEAHIRQRCEVVECVRGAPTGVVGVHAGPGAWGVFYQQVRDDDPLLTDTG